MTTFNQEGLTSRPRQCIEISEPYITTLGLVLWDKVTLDLETILEIFIQLCDLLTDTHKSGYAVGTLHPEGIVLHMHGDRLKSAHIKRSGAPCQVAFTEEISLSFDKSNYLSPEQLDGLSPTPCSDIYALGSIMYTALNGAPPIEGERITIKLLTLKKRQAETASEPKRELLNAVIDVCLQNDETKRYRSAAALKAELVRIQKGLKPERAKKENNVLNFPGAQKFATGAALCLTLWLVSWTAIQGQTSPTIEGIWNKSPGQYEYGDRFSITLATKKKCYAYLFYLDEYDQAMAIFPSRHQGNNVIGKNTPLAVENVSSNLMHVDTTPGRLLIVSIADGERGREIKEKFLKDRDWDSDRKPIHHWLRLSGKDLIKKLQLMRASDPDVVYFSVEDAPRAREKPQQLKFGKPQKYEISIHVNEHVFRLTP